MSHISSQNNSFYFKRYGELPILVSMPHSGIVIPHSIRDKMLSNAQMSVDTDWYLDKLYRFVFELPLSVLMAKYSRYVIDLNRDPSGKSLYPDQNTTELCPTTQFDNSPIYINSEKPDQGEILRRIQAYWQPYHRFMADQLEKMQKKWGVALVFDAHSIAHQVPRFFSGHLDDINWGSNAMSSCAPELIEMIKSVETSPFTNTFDGRFKGGYITRHYGQPNKHIHAIQLELSQLTYMREANIKKNIKPKFLPEKSKPLQAYLKKIFQVLIQWIEQNR
ncbi:MAG: N-formylglutamate deformylase [Pseudomonadota bacterium]